MVRASIIITIILAAFTPFQALAADNAVRVTIDGRVVDASGNTIAIPNTTDPRNTDYNKYYTSLDATGKPAKDSDFYIYSDPGAGYRRKDLPPVADSAVTSQLPQPDVKASVTNLGSTSEQINSDYSRPVYDDLKATGSAYGN